MNSIFVELKDFIEIFKIILYHILKKKMTFFKTLLLIKYSYLKFCYI